MKYFLFKAQVYFAFYKIVPELSRFMIKFFVIKYLQSKKDYTLVIFTSFLLFGPTHDKFLIEEHFFLKNNFCRMFLFLFIKFNFKNGLGSALSSEGFNIFYIFYIYLYIFIYLFFFKRVHKVYF